MTLGIGLEAMTTLFEPSIRLPDGTLVQFVRELSMGVGIGGGLGSSFPLLSVHLDDVRSLTGNASLAFTVGRVQGLSNLFSAGVLATF